MIEPGKSAKINGLLTNRRVLSEDGSVVEGRLNRDDGGYLAPAHLLRSETPRAIRPEQIRENAMHADVGGRSARDRLR
jgi:hypothetical protein